MKKNILFVSGLPDHHIVEVASASLNGAVKYKCPGTCDFYLYMSPPDWNKRLIMLDKRSIPVELAEGTHYIFNQIAEPDTHSNVLDRLQHICNKHPQIPVFNAPEHIALTRRDVVYQRLQGIKNLIIPQTLRFHPQSPQDILNAVRESGMQYPVILRTAGLHNSQGVVRLDSPEHLDVLHRFALDGRPYYLIQYHETAQQGVYTKHRVVMVRGQVFPRHICAFDHWMIEFTKARAFMTSHPEYTEQETHFIQNFSGEFASQLAPIAEAIYKKMPLDFVGIDCCLLPSGEVMIFEINNNMLTLTCDPHNPSHVEAVVKIKTAIYEAVQKDLRR